MRRIICVGNRLLREDAAGPAVFDALGERELPGDVEAVDGGLLGLDLLRLVEGAERVVFVDALATPEATPGPVVLRPEDAARLASGRYDHGAGLAYLLAVLPGVCEGPIPEIAIVGVSGPPEGETIRAAAALSVQLAVGSSGRAEGRTVTSEAHDDR